MPKLHDSLYGVDVYCFTSLDSMYKAANKLCKVDRAGNCAGRCMSLVTDSGQLCVFIYASNLTTLVHECVHACNMVFESRGILLSTQHDEHQAYYIDWLFKNFKGLYNA